jgi:hypothetical protein
MKKNDVIKWYNENTNAELNDFFLDKMINLGIIKEDIDLSFLNLILLERFNDKFIIENGKYRLKKNRLPLIEQSKSVEIAPIKDDKLERMKVAVGKLGEQPKRFKIEKINGNRLKLVKK